MSKKRVTCLHSVVFFYNQSEERKDRLEAAIAINGMNVLRQLLAKALKKEKSKNDKAFISPNVKGY